LSQKTRNKDSWIESQEYPGSGTQIIVSVVVLILATVGFINFSTGDNSISTAFFAIFASLTFSILIFPHYLEFSGISAELVSQGMTKIKTLNGIYRFMPILSLISIFLVLPLMIVLIAPSALFWSSITGIIAGFAIQRLTFLIYVKNWSRNKGLKVTRYSVVTRNELGKRLILERGFKTGKI
jgi:hypothetical protein